MIGRALLFLSMMLSTFLAVTSPANEVTFESKPARTHLLELFTSEGCSSCPPAEAWLSNLKKEPQLWRDFVPIAFHVDYWDHLGWRDPFASKIWTARQSEYSTRWKSSSVYTPGFVLDGREWQNRNLPPASSESIGVLRVTLANVDRVTATFAPASGGARNYEIHVARLGFDLNTDVKAGENRGRKLLHDFVVLSLTNEAMSAGTKELRFPAVTSNQSADARTALAAWLTEAGQIEPLQAVGGWLP
ncbi:MAG: DUF1223 domain-containing protein [Chthoniobacterales bacterium]|nr:MAG: DUF1223 domain-containing protein [Chthoniobacterales bacterium]